MAVGTIGIICLIIFFILLFMGFPVAFCMIVIGWGGVAAIVGFPQSFAVISGDIYTQFSSYTMTVVPLFALMGYLAHSSGLGDKLFDTAYKFIGHWPGGLAIATDAACAGFGAICGSIPATVATMSSIAYPQMKRYGYKDQLSAGIIAAASGLSVLIPPSVTLIIFGIATETSVGRLFAAGIGPGVALAVFMAIAIIIIVKRNPSLAPKSDAVPWKDRFSALLHGGVLEIIVVFLVSIGGLFLGFFTPTEGGAVGAVGMLIVCLIQRTLKWKDFIESLSASVKLSAMVMVLLAGASIFSRMFALSRIPNSLGNWVESLVLPDWAIMTVIIFIYLILGLIMEEFAAVIITIPIFFPIVTQTLGYGAEWFCVVMVIVMLMGALSPPIGMNVFYTIGAIKNLRLQDVFRGVIPFLICELILALIMVFFPSLATFIPDLIYGVG